jgi:hypothetical protein
MAHTISERRRLERLKEMEPELYREMMAAPRREVAHAQRLVWLWNKRAARGRPTSFYPTFATAKAAGRQILQVFCPGCRTIGEVDLRAHDFHAAAPISALIPKLSCRRCSPNPPLAVLIALAEHKTLGQRRWIPAPRRPIY